jgi:tetratricopeptide (TPR) repeat protein
MQPLQPIHRTNNNTWIGVLIACFVGFAIFACAVVVVAIVGVRHGRGLLSELLLSSVARDGYTVNADDLSEGMLPSDLKMLSNPRAVFVAQPQIGAGLLSTLSAFTDGCGNWLEFNLSGQPELGASVLWTEGSRVRVNMKRSNLRLTLSDSDELYMTTGSNIAAYGSVTGTPVNLTLSYQLYSLPNKNPIGRPIAITGSPDKIILELPKLATMMRTELGITTLPPPAVNSVDMNVDQFSACGRVDEYYYRGSDADDAVITKAAENSVYAACLHMYSNDYASGEVQYDKYVNGHIIARAGGWPAAIGAIAEEDPTALRSYSTVLDASITKYPNNYQLLQARSLFERNIQDYCAAISDATRSLKANPNSSYAWGVLGMSYKIECDHIRNGRYISDMSRSQQVQYMNWGSLWLGCYEKSVRLDPKDGHLWYRVGDAASAIGTEHEAFGALNEAILLGPRSVKCDAYAEALNLSLPQWYGTNHAQHYIDQMKSDFTITPADMVNCSGALEEFAKPTAQNLYAAALDRAYTEFTKNPADPDALYDMSHVKEKLRIKQAAASYLRRALVIEPSNADWWVELGGDYRALDAERESLAAYHRALSLRPNYLAANEGVVDMYLAANDYHHSIPYAQAVLAEVPNDPNSLYALSYAYDAMKLYDKSVALIADYDTKNPAHIWTTSVEMDALVNDGKYKQAIKRGNYFLSYTASAMMLAGTAQAYARSHDDAKAMQLCQHGAAEGDDEADVDEVLGEVYMDEGDRANAQKYWTKTLAVNVYEPETMQEARDFLKKNHMPVPT